MPCVVGVVMMGESVRWIHHWLWLFNFEEVLMKALLLGDCMLGMTSILIPDYMRWRWMCHQQIESLQSSFSVGWKSIYQWMNLTSLSESMAHHHRLHGHLRDSHVLEDLLLWVQLVCAVEFIVRSGQVHSFEWYAIMEKPYVKNFQSESFYIPECDEVVWVWSSREVLGVSMQRISNATDIYINSILGLTETAMATVSWICLFGVKSE